MVFDLSLNGFKSPQVSRTPLSIMADFNSAIVWMISTRFLMSTSANPCTNPLITVPRAIITIGITINFMFHSFFTSLARSRYLSLFSPSFNFTLWSARTAKSTIRQVLCFLLTISRSGCLAEIRWSVCISNSRRIFCISFSRTDSGLYRNLLFAWSNSNFLYSSQWLTFHP